MDARRNVTPYVASVLKLTFRARNSATVLGTAKTQILDMCFESNTMSPVHPPPRLIILLPQMRALRIEINKIKPISLLRFSKLTLHDIFQFHY